MSHPALRIALATALLAALPALATGQASPQRLTLGDAARLAARQGGSAVGARFRAAEVTARIKENRASLLPSVSAAWSDGERTFNTASFGFRFPGFDPNGSIIGPVRVADVRARMGVPIVDPTSLGKYRSAQAAATAADADAIAAAGAAASAAAAAYVRALRADAQVAARASDSTLAAELLGIAQTQLQAGVGIALDVTRARAQLSTVRTQLIAARNERDRAHLELVRTIGLPIDTPVELADSLTGGADPVPTVVDAMAEARRSRPDFRAAQANIESARVALRATRAERLPMLGGFVDQGYTSGGYAHLMRTWTWGLQVSVPVFEGFRTEAKAEQRQAAIRQAEVRLHDVELQAEADVRAGLVDVAAAREQVDAATERLGLAEQELAQARDRFRAGVSGNADVITAQLALDVSRTQLVDALAAQRGAQVALARAMGRTTSLP